MITFLPHNDLSIPDPDPSRGTDVSVAREHIRMFGNIDRLDLTDLAEQVTPHLERLEKIGDMLMWNQNKIDTEREHIRTLAIFGSVQKHRDRLLFNIGVRERLKRIWNREIKSLTL